MTPTTTPMAAWLESAWLARYLDRQLSGEEAAWFEAYLLDKPELLGMVEVDNALRDGLAAQATTRSAVGSGRQVGAIAGDASQAAYASVSNHETAEQRPSVKTFSAGVPRWAALAASLVLGLGFGWMGQRVLSQQRGEMPLIASPMRVVYDTMRGDSVPPHVEHEDSSSPYVLIEVAVPSGAEHIALEFNGRPPTALTLSPDGFVSFLLDRNSVMATSVGYIRYSVSGRSEIKVLDLKSR